MIDSRGFWIFLTFLTIFSFLFAAFIIWLKHIAPHGEYRKEMDALRLEVASLAAAIGLQKRGQQMPRFGPPPVGPQL